MKRIAIVGANGQLGSDLVALLQSSGQSVAALTRADVELRNHDQVSRVLEALSPQIIINTAAFHKVEACEIDIEQAFAVNSFAVRHLAMAADRLNAVLVHISTDYVFDGDTANPYSEAAGPNPLNAYGVSKVSGEYFIQGLCPRHLIIRTSGLYGRAGSSGKGGNFVETMLRLAREKGEVSVVNDQHLSPTYTKDLASTIAQLLDARITGLFHVTNSGSCSWYEFATAIFDLAGLKVVATPINTNESGTSVRRPRFSVLANDRLTAAGLSQLRPWRDALAQYLAATGRLVGTSREAGVANAAN